VLRPMFRLDAVRLARKNEAMIRIAGLPNWPAVRDAMKREPAVAQVPPPQTTLPSYYVGPGPGPAASHTKPVDYTRFLSTDVCTSPGFSSARAVEQTMRLCVERRMVAVSLAARLYRADHDGAFPASLDALVPAYLPHVPVDPFSPDNKPLGYVVARGALPDGGDRPLVYSVGRDGVDDTAAGGLSGLPRTPCFGVDSKTVDQWRDLARWTPALTPQEQQAEEAQEKAAATQPAK
jgi:hypothetical protein